MELVFELEGHRTLTERIVPDVDQRLRVTLAPIVEPPERAPAASSTSSMRPSAHGMRPRPREPEPEPEIVLWE